GVPSLQKKAKADYGLDVSEEDARRFSSAFFATWPGIARWHHELKRRRWRQMIRLEPAEVHTLAGRRIIVKPDLWHGARANYIVQGTGGDGIKQALALLWERKEQCPGAFPVLAVHDEIVVECDAAESEAVAGWLKQAMVDAMAPLIEPVPVEVEPKIAQTGGGT